MAGNKYERMNAKAWICLGIWLVAMIVFTICLFTKQDVNALMALSAAIIAGMFVVAWETSDVNKM